MRLPSHKCLKTRPEGTSVAPASKTWMSAASLTRIFYPGSESPPSTGLLIRRKSALPAHFSTTTGSRTTRFAVAWPFEICRLDTKSPFYGTVVVEAAVFSAQTGIFYSASTKNRPWREAAEKVECFFSPENLIIEMIPDFVLFGIIFSILTRLFLSKCAF